MHKRAHAQARARQSIKKGPASPPAPFHPFIPSIHHPLRETSHTLTYTHTLKTHTVHTHEETPDTQSSRSSLSKRQRSPCP